MAVNILGGGMDDDIGAMLKGAAQAGCSERIVDDQRDLHVAGNLGKFLEIEHVQAGIADGFGKQGAGLGAKRRLDFFFAGIGVDEGDFDAKFGKGVGEQGIGAAVERAGSHDMLTGPADIEQRDG